MNCIWVIKDRQLYFRLASFTQRELCLTLFPRTVKNKIAFLKNKNKIKKKREKRKKNKK